VLRFEAKWTGHIAAAGVEKVDFGTGGAHEVDAVLHCHQELLMASDGHRRVNTKGFVNPYEVVMDEVKSDRSRVILSENALVSRMKRRIDIRMVRV
jgi:hypothetical protein